MTPAQALADLHRELTGAEAPPITVTGADPVLPGRFLVGTAAAAGVGAATLAAAELFAARGGDPGLPSVDVRQAALAFRSERYLQVDGQPVGDVWSPVSGDYRGADGWVRVHANYPHHEAAAATALGVTQDKAAIAEAIGRLPVREVEDRVYGAGGVATAMRTAAQWRAHPAGIAVHGIPLVDARRIDDAPPIALPAGQRPLSGVRVLDLTHVIAGPVCGRTLAAHGAEVLHIGAQHLPTVAPLVLDNGFDKRSAWLDLRTENGRDTLRALVAQADVLVQSFRPGALAALGFGAAELARLRPGIVAVDLSAWGHEGPWRARRGFDSLVQMSCGIADAGARIAGLDRPSPLPAQALDHATGWLAAAAVMTALRRRMVEGGSWQIRLALARTAVWLDGLGRLPADVPEAAEPAVPADLMTQTPSDAGLLRHLRVPGDLPGARPGWRRGARQPGADQPLW